MSVDRVHLLSLIDEASQLTSQALIATPGAAMFVSIGAQLQAIRADVQRGGSFDATIQRRVNIGLLAVREFEQTDPEYAALLEQIAFQYQDEGLLR